MGQAVHVRGRGYMRTPLYLLLHFLRETKTALKTNVYLERKKWEEMMKKEKYVYRYLLKY